MPSRDCPNVTNLPKSAGLRVHLPTDAFFRGGVTPPTPPRRDGPGFVITLAVALETGFLISFFMSGKYNRKFALQVIFAVRALLAIPFYFGISQWMNIPFYFTLAVCNFSAFIIVNIYASEVIPTSHRALATGIENTAGNVGLFIGDFFALYLIHVNYYAVLAALQGVTIAAILIISVFVIDTKNIPLSDS